MAELEKVHLELGLFRLLGDSKESEIQEQGGEYSRLREVRQSPQTGKTEVVKPQEADLCELGHSGQHV